MLMAAVVVGRYFGGDLEVKSLEGFGMDSYLHLCKLGDRCEDLGLQVRMVLIA
jgi:serine protease inhibitor ecotin